MVDFFIIIPTLNSAAFLERCLVSLITSQNGNFRLRVRIQDGGSNDATASIAERWKDRGVIFTSEPDAGLYDAVNRASKDLCDSEIMTWLGSDDILMPGALATVASIFEQLPDVRWVSGQAFCGSETGESFTPWPPLRFVRSRLAAGYYRSHVNGFLMQEGTFWRADLWRAVGGIDERFRIAGDWDLWRRFAQVSPLYSVTFPLARFTIRAGQKSSEMAPYYKEIEETAPGPAVDDECSYELIRRGPKDRWIVEKHDHRPWWRRFLSGN